MVKLSRLTEETPLSCPGQSVNHACARQFEDKSKSSNYENGIKHQTHSGGGGSPEAIVQA